MSIDHDPTKIVLQTNVKKERDPTLVRMSGTAIHGNTPFDVPFMSEIMPGLYQGGCQTGLIMPHFIHHVVSLYPWERYKIEHNIDSELYVRMYDSVEQGYEQVEEIAQWAFKRWQDGNVLIHCQAGLNRSSLIAARVLMLSGYTAKEAIAKLRKSRSPACLCNPAFEEYLLSL